MLLLGATFLTLCFLRVGCAHGCTHDSAKHRPNITCGTRYAHDLQIFLGFAPKAYVRKVTRIGDADVAETQGFASSMPKANKKKRLATRDTLHRSRPNIRQCDPNGRIAPTPSSVSDKGASMKRCARRKEERTIIRKVYISCFHSLHLSDSGFG